jgi:hypothetical protein
MIPTYYKGLDSIFLQIKDFLDMHNKSEVLQDYCLNEISSFLYGTIINNFFTNLNKTNVDELNLPKGNIGKIKNKYRDIQKDVKSALKIGTGGKNIDKDYYNNFKKQIKIDFPEYEILITEIEKELDIIKAESYLKRKQEEIKNLGNHLNNLNTLFMTKIAEAYILENNRLPIGKKTDKSIKTSMNSLFNKFSDSGLELIKKDTKDIIESQRECLADFEENLYSIWEEPIDLYECLIKISLEYGEKHADKIRKTADNSNDFKRDALIKIHARALQISNEILVLIKSGFADGAFARWRSLHELAVIAFFLSNNNNQVSQRYLEHEVIKKFKEIRDYRSYYKKLGYPPADRKEFNKLKREYDRLCKKYSDGFHGDYGWVPKTILKDRNFKTLEKHIKLDKFRPFYNLSSNAVHGGSKGFYRLGLMNDWQGKVLLAGASNYGLADPIQNASISLLHASICLLSIEIDIENLVTSKIMFECVKEICLKAVNIQKQIEKDESELS